MTLHSPTENNLAVLNNKILEANSQVQNVKLDGHQTCISINRLWHELCDMLRRLVGTTAPGHLNCSIQERKSYDEAHFWLNGCVNKQNCRIWSEANPQVYVETPLHPEKLIVWCALWAGGIIGPYFFKNDEGHNVTVNGDRYRAMIINFFIPELNNHDVQELWFQRDGETCHTARVLKDTFGDRLISRFGPVNWPPRSCDLTPLDYFLWGYVKSLVYADKPQTLNNVRRVIADIYVGKSHRKLDVQIGLHPSQPWQSYARNHI
ncbi:putative DD41D transposase [Trichonephila clavipes]|nr:putative DD41D transposase [Trichonephila clavipes]